MSHAWPKGSEQERLGYEADWPRDRIWLMFEAIDVLPDNIRKLCFQKYHELTGVWPTDGSDIDPDCEYNMDADHFTAETMREMDAFVRDALELTDVPSGIAQ